MIIKLFIGAGRKVRVPYEMEDLILFRKMAGNPFRAHAQSAVLAAEFRGDEKESWECSRCQTSSLNVDEKILSDKFKNRTMWETIAAKGCISNQ